MPPINRRELARNIAASIAVGRLALDTKISAAEQPAAILQWTSAGPGIWRARLGMPEQHTPISMRSVPPAQDALARLPTVSSPSVIGVSGVTTTRGCRLLLPLDPGELLYGFGLQLLSLQQRGKKRIVRVNADPKGDSGDSHAPVPFYVSSRGYGILVDTLRHAEFYCGEAHPAPTTPLPSAATAVNTPQETRERELNRTSNVVVEVPRSHGVDVYLFAGPSMLNAVQRYNMFSGGGVAPPEWGLGFWYRPEMHLAQQEVLALAHDFRANKIPCDVLGLEPGWQTHAYSCSFIWEPTRFPRPEEFVRSALALNFKINLWEHAFTHPSSLLFEPLKPHAGDFAVWDGLVPDFAGEPARRIFGEYHGKHFIDAGVSGFKLDECDNSDYTDGWSFPDLTRFPSGLDGEQMHAIFGLGYQQAIWQAFKDRHLETYSLVRSSGALAAPYPFVLYSDLYDHREFVRGILNAGFSGLLWCPEVRDAASEEDLIRRLQTAVFSPLAMVNAWYIRNPPWVQLNRELNNKDSYLANWQQLQSRCREIIDWRMRLIPYLRSAFNRYVLDGTPPFRAPVLDHPEQTALHNLDDEYLIGDRMLVAPLFAGEPDRTITLPEGEWHDFWTGERVPSNFQVSSTAEKIPVFVRAGSVLPMADVSASTAAQESRRITVQVYGNGSIPWELNPTHPGELRLAWSHQNGSGQGSFEQSPSSRPYSIAGWEKMG